MWRREPAWRRRRPRAPARRLGQSGIGPATDTDGAGDNVVVGAGWRLASAVGSAALGVVGNGKAAGDRQVQSEGEPNQMNQNEVGMEDPAEVGRLQSAHPFPLPAVSREAVVVEQPAVSRLDLNVRMLTGPDA